MKVVLILYSCSTVSEEDSQLSELQKHQRNHSLSLSSLKAII